jgi:hypothetical protein
MSGLSLYAIREDYEQLIEQAMAEAAENEGVISDALAEALEEVSESLESKIINCGHAYKNRLAEAEAISAEVKRLQARAKAANGAAEWLKRYIERNATAGTKFNYTTISIGWRKSQETVISDEALIPQEYCKIKVEPSKSLIKEAIVKGIDVPGAQVVEKINIQIK